MVDRTCLICGKAFQVPYPSTKRKTCSYDCRWQSMRTTPRSPRADKGTRKTKPVAAKCAACSKTFEVWPSRLNKARRRGWHLYCSVRCKESVSQGGRPPKDGVGARFIDGNGYVRIYVPPDERPPGYEKTTVLEHRVVMARSLKRHLLPHETVHHINGDKTDNRLKNLQLRSGRHGTGASLRCRSCGSHDIESVELS